MTSSKYTTVFRSKSEQCYVYNALSNRLFRIDESTFIQLNRSAESNIPTTVAAEAESLFPDPMMFASTETENRILEERRRKRDKINSDTSYLDLSICPTLHCNFRCNYCFEADQHTTKKMDSDTIDQLMRFIDSCRDARSIGISWYGGEPLVGFGAICEITDCLLQSDKEFLGAGLITNGFLLTREKIALLNSLKITSVQVTLDGPRGVHDARRHLASKKPTFDRILANLDNLLSSDYSGSCNIRVNLDGDNLGSFLDLQQELMERYDGKKFSVYAGRVERLGGLGAACSSCSDTTDRDWVELTKNQCASKNKCTSEQLYPTANLANICTATMKNAFVIGPRGELYKCWEEVGRSDCIVGNISTYKSDTENEYISLYETAGDPYLDDECRNCRALPICGGGCANRRIRKIYRNENGIDYCSLYKDHLIEFLREVTEKEEETNICRQLLGLDRPPTPASAVEEIHVAETGQQIVKF